jgi:glycosyltransferase involved in cell wall biosynthesis
MALPVVTFDLPESVVTATGAALFAAGNDEAAFAGRVEDLLSDPELRARLGASGRARVARAVSASTSSPSARSSWWR